MTREEALQAVVAGEHAAIYAFGVIGGQLQGSAEASAARAAWDEHRDRRDQVSALLVVGGAAVPAAAPAYDLGGPVVTRAAAGALAASVEIGCCGPYADLVGVGVPAERRLAASWLSRSATDAVRWGSEPAVFPGLTERTG